MTVSSKPFGVLPDGKHVSLFALANRNGMAVEIMNYGGALVRVLVPDRAGNVADVVLGYNTLGEYLGKNPYHGCIIGRYGNRIAKGRFTLDGVEYALAVNNGPNSLHGGKVGFDKKLWKAETREEADRAVLRLVYVSPDMEEGYPGSLSCMVEYAVTDANELVIDYSATSDKPTVVNLTNHSYWNLAGESSGTILDHVVTLHAEQFAPVDDGYIPTGEYAPVEGTPMDFTTPTAIGARMDDPFPQLRLPPGGYDHNYLVRGEAGTLRPAALVLDPKSGRSMEVLTTEPAIQFYVGNFLDGSVKGKGGVPYVRNAGLCLETQHCPDAPNKPEFASTVLRPGTTYRHTAVLRFGAT